jgi:hypothetical protein
MTITIDWQNKLVQSDSDILDILAFKEEVRVLETSAEGIYYDQVITFKRVDLGGGAFFPAVDLINGYQLKFPTAGNYTIVGNISGTIVPVAGVYVERKTSAAFAVVADSSGGPSVIDELNNIQSNLEIINQGVQDASIFVPHTTDLIP